MKIDFKPKGWGENILIKDSKEIVYMYQPDHLFEKEAWEHIVHCVNTHDELVEALKDLIKCSCPPQDSIDELEKDMAIDKAKAALKKAKS